ncbi:Uncharacterised protein [Pseudomonas mucidolens]|nr:Uncharacterised protein [Pseudomonas mucidolens]
MLAKIVNDDAGTLDEPIVLGVFASKLAPTGDVLFLRNAVAHFELRLVPGFAIEDFAKDFYRIPHLGEAGV